MTKMEGYRGDMVIMDEVAWVLNEYNKRRPLYDAFYAGWMAGLDESTDTINLFNDWYDKTQRLRRMESNEEE